MNNHVVYKLHNASHIYSMLLIPMSRHRRCVHDMATKSCSSEVHLHIGKGTQGHEVHALDLLRDHEGGRERSITFLPAT